MEPRPKKLVIWAWIVSVLTSVVVAPITFIMGVFASDNATGAGNPVSYALILFPLIYILIPALMQVFYVKGRDTGARRTAYAAFAACGASVALLVLLFSGVL